MQDFFDLLDEITKQIAIELQAELTSGNTLRSLSKTTNFQAWANNVKGLRYSLRYTEEDAFKAREYFEKAIKLDPDFAGAIAALAANYWQVYSLGWSKSPLEDLGRCEELLKRAKDIDENLSYAYAISSLAALIKMDHKKALEEAKKAIALGPNDPMNYHIFAVAKYFTGSFQEAVALCEKVKRLSPYRLTHQLMSAGWSYRMIGKYEKAIEIFMDLLDRAKRGEFNILMAHNYLACTYAMQGNIPKARFHAAEVLKINPNHSLEFNRAVNWFENPKHLEPILDALRKAGIPDTAPQNGSL
jgi:adenylate cyclase